MNILLTKKLAQDQLDLIQSWGWSYETVETLKITSVEVKEIPVKADAWIVSSRNSFSGVEKFIEEGPQQMYCVGGWVKKEVERWSSKISVKSFESIKSLTTDLVKQNFQNVIYFCGEEHRQELEEELHNTNTKITKLITHKSEMIFPVTKNSFDAVFVFSPRSAESLLKENQFSSQTVFACIGATTENYLHNRGIENTFVPSFPESKILLEEFHHTLNLKF
jgi:uroporphyrinogen-III synthase